MVIAMNRHLFFLYHLQVMEDIGQGRETPCFEIDAHALAPLDGRKDGTSYLELMEGGISESIQYEIQDIVREEVTPLFRWSKIGTGSGWDNPEQGAVISGGTEIRGEMEMDGFLENIFRI